MEIQIDISDNTIVDVIMTFFKVRILQIRVVSLKLSQEIGNFLGQLYIQVSLCSTWSLSMIKFHN